jgi:hypothetical protein
MRKIIGLSINIFFALLSYGQEEKAQKLEISTKISPGYTKLSSETEEFKY